MYNYIYIYIYICIYTYLYLYIHIYIYNSRRLAPSSAWQPSSIESGYRGGRRAARARPTRASSCRTWSECADRPSSRRRCRPRHPTKKEKKKKTDYAYIYSDLDGYFYR